MPHMPDMPRMFLRAGHVSPRASHVSLRARRFLVGAVVIAPLAALALAGVAVAAGKLWECNWCHQQYQGDRPPPFTKCPAKDMKQNHWWIQKN